MLVNLLTSYLGRIGFNKQTNTSLTLNVYSSCHEVATLTVRNTMRKCKIYTKQYSTSMQQPRNAKPPELLCILQVIEISFREWQTKNMYTVYGYLGWLSCINYCHLS